MTILNVHHRAAGSILPIQGPRDIVCRLHGDPGGMTEEDARALLVSGFADNVSKELPVEYAVEMNNLIRLEMKGSIG